MRYNKVTIKALRVQRGGKDPGIFRDDGNFMEQMLFKLGFDNI